MSTRVHFLHRSGELRYDEIPPIKHTEVMSLQKYNFISFAFISTGNEQTSPHCNYNIFFLSFIRIDAARGFGMRVVGGKTGTDGRLFAYLVWTVPGGPAEKNGLQQGDKVSNEITNWATIRVIIYRVCVNKEFHASVSYVICCG